MYLVPLACPRGRPGRRRSPLRPPSRPRRLVRDVEQRHPLAPTDGPLVAPGPRHSLPESRRRDRSSLEVAPSVDPGPRNVAAYARAHACVPELPSREPRRCRLLHGMCGASGTTSGGPRGPQDRHRRVLRRHRLDGAGRAARPRVLREVMASLLRGDAGRDRAPRRHGREVHRRRGRWRSSGSRRSTRTTRCAPSVPPPRCARRSRA